MIGTQRKNVHVTTKGLIIIISFISANVVLQCELVISWAC